MARIYKRLDRYTYEYNGHTKIAGFFCSRHNSVKILIVCQLNNRQVKQNAIKEQTNAAKQIKILSSDLPQKVIFAEERHIVWLAEGASDLQYMAFECEEKKMQRTLIGYLLRTRFTHFGCCFVWFVS